VQVRGKGPHLRRLSSSRQQVHDLVGCCLRVIAAERSDRTVRHVFDLEGFAVGDADGAGVVVLLPDVLPSGLWKSTPWGSPRAVTACRSARARFST